MSKAKEIYYKAVMAAENQEPPKDYCISAHADHFNGFVEGFVEGYHQAEKDLELGWEDMEKVFDLCYEVLRDVYLMKFPDDKEEQKEFYQEVLKRFKDLKK